MPRVFRCGTGLVEMLIGVALCLLLATVLCTILSLVTRMARAGADNCDGVQSVLMAAEALRRDAGRMLFQLPDDLAISPDRRSMSMLIVKEEGADLWSLEGEAVRYSLRPMDLTPGTFQLLRADSRGERPLRGCTLASASFRFVPRGEVSSRLAFIEVTLVGVRASTRSTAHVARVLLPVTHIDLPRMARFQEGKA